MAEQHAVVIGGGFFGCATAIHLAQQGWHIDVLEQGLELMQRASYINQARLHNGYHYPRSFQTAIRSRVNMPQFCEIYPEAVFTEFRPLYAIARYDSKVSAGGFAHFCKAARIPLQRATQQDRDLFDRRLIEEVFEAIEPAFDAQALLAYAKKALPSLGIAVHTQTKATTVNPMRAAPGELLVTTQDKKTYAAKWVFNCTYAALNHVSGQLGGPQMSLQHKISEVLLVTPPAELKNRGITLMDGDFFSIMPFPARGLHSLTHVRHTHHFGWEEASQNTEKQPNPLGMLDDYLNSHPNGATGRSRGAWMIHDAQRFVPSIKDVKVIEPLFEVKTLMTQTTVDDARPILFHRDPSMPGFISIMGGKIDNIFDVLAYIDKLLPPVTKIINAR